MRVADFDFELPPDLIAQHPASPRDSARLLAVFDKLSDLSVRDLPGLLAPGDVLVVNDTRVIPARLRGRRAETGGAIEVTLIQPEADGAWRALARPARRLKPGSEIEFSGELTATVRARGEDGGLVLGFDADADALARHLDARGIMPLPPYIKRGPEGDPRDRADYQTLFAERPGAVAAPTAGLHFTPDLVHAIEDRGARLVRVTLHVGAGTFLPVKATDTRDHRMHAEWGGIGAEAADAVNACRDAGGRVVAVGSTALRLLETAAGDDGRLKPFQGETDIFITPGYRFRIVDALLTNFHLPRSTLFMLVAAFAGLDRMKAAYAHAKRAGYRFYSYGDACFLERAEP